MIRIARVALPVPLATRMAELSTQIGGASPDNRSILAKDLWRKTSTRNAVCAPLKLVLSEMAQMVETVREQPFADVCQAMLRQAVAPGAAALFWDFPDLVETLRFQPLRDLLLH